MTPTKEPDRQITAADRHAAVARRLDDPAWWEGQYIEAIERVVSPGEFDEIAKADSEAAIEVNARDKVSVFVHDSIEEHREYEPDEARRLAFNLLALADLAEGSKDG